MPSKDTPPIFLAVSNAVAVAALPVVEPDDPLTLPVTLPVRFPTKVDEVNAPVLGLYVKPLSVSIPSVPPKDTTG